MAKTPRRTAKKSNRVDFCPIVSHVHLHPTDPCHASPGASHTYIPVLLPLCQVWMVDPPVATNMLSGPHYHVLRRRDVYHGRFARVGIRHPYRYREAVCRAAKGDRQRASEKKKECRRSILVCYICKYARTVREGAMVGDAL